jgi:hypothetical protein
MEEQKKRINNKGGEGGENIKGGEEGRTTVKEQEGRIYKGGVGMESI